jgi:hypothetical protein
MCKKTEHNSSGVPLLTRNGNSSNVNKKSSSVLPYLNKEPLHNKNAQILKK